jgi:hypothetical protein
VTGHRALLVLAAVLYGFAWLFGRRHVTLPLADRIRVGEATSSV